MRKIRRRTKKELYIIKEFLEDYTLGDIYSNYIISKDMLKKLLSEKPILKKPVVKKPIRK